MNKAMREFPILLIDDDAMVRGIVSEYLKEMGFENVLEARDSKHGLELIRNTKFPIGLILSDWEMPDVNGLTLLKALRKNPQRRGTRFIMITSQRSMERFKITQAAQWKVSSYLIKPFTCETLKEKIWQVMGWSETDKKIAG